MPAIPARSRAGLPVIERSLFGEVADALHGLLPRDLGTLRCIHHRYGIKVWFASEGPPPKEHYEAQVVGHQHAPDATALALEVGFHSEHSKEADNEAVISGLLRHEEAWRTELGGDPVAASFLGRAEHWRRVSETWPDPDLSDPELVFEIAARLTDYVTALEPCRRARASDRTYGTNDVSWPGGEAVPADG